MKQIDFNSLPTPCYIVDERLLVSNLKLLKSVSDKSGAKILLAQKAFSMFSVYPIIAEYLCGTTASGIYEAKLGFEEMGKPYGKETHVFAPAYKQSEITELVKICDHIVFNSCEQWNKFKAIVRADKKHIECGIRINPEYSEIETDIYNPCFENSRLGTTLANFDAEVVDEIDGLHFHTMCEQNSDTLKRTIAVVEEKFGKFLHKLKWLNFGGGHHITRADYDVETLIECVKYIRNKYDVDVYLEPGEAIALNTGYLVSEVLHIGKNNMNFAIMDTSAACHMPDVLEMPYRPHIINSDMPNRKEFTYRLGGPTCLAGDIIGDYSFDKPLNVGDKLVFCDMAHYSMVKNNTFNGMPLPSILLYTTDNEVKVIKNFSYDDFKSRLS